MYRILGIFACSFLLAWIYVPGTSPAAAKPAHRDSHPLKIENVGPHVSTPGSHHMGSSLARARTLSDLAASALAHQEIQTAESLLQQAIGLYPRLPEAHANIGYLYTQTGRAKEAIPHLKYAADALPESPAVLANLAGAHQLSGDLPAALAIYKTYTDRFPQAVDSPVVLHMISSLEREMRAQRLPHLGLRPPSWDVQRLANLRFCLISNGSPDAVRTKHELDAALTRWQSTGLVAFQWVEDPQQCDVLCRIEDNPRTLASWAEGGEVRTRHRGDQIVGAAMVLAAFNPVQQRAWTDEELYSLCLHEVGHALGLRQHSRNPEDVMFCTIRPRGHEAGPTGSDFTSLHDLYDCNEARDVADTPPGRADQLAGLR